MLTVVFELMKDVSTFRSPAPNISSQSWIINNNNNNNNDNQKFSDYRKTKKLEK